MKLADKIKAMAPELDLLHQQRMGYFFAREQAAKLAAAHDALLQQAIVALEIASAHLSGSDKRAVDSALRACKEQQ